MEAHLAFLVTPDKTDRQATAQLATCRLVADATVETGAQDMQLGLAHGAFETQQEPVVEKCRMIDAIRITDERVGETGEIDQAMPVGVVARQT